MGTYAFGLISALWGTWGIYWLLSRRGAKTTRQRESPASMIAHLVPLIAGVALFELNSPFDGTWLGGRFMPESLAAYVIGIAMTAAGLGFTVWARRHLGANWSGMAVLKHDHQLIQSGPYRFVRHPIYAGVLFAAVGSGVALGEWRCAAGLALLIFTFVRRTIVEERLMRQAFGDRYDQYSAQVPALIPYIY